MSERTVTAAGGTLSNVTNFVLFQAVWFACVVGGANGRPWLGPIAVLAFALVHLALFGRPGEARLLVLVTLIGTLVDSGLRGAGLLTYASEPDAWPAFLVPPWIVALWTAFAALLRHSLAWLGRRPGLAFAFGAIGGPLSFLGGQRLGAVGLGQPEILSLGALSVEWALLTPLLLALSLSRSPDLSN